MNRSDRTYNQLIALLRETPTAATLSQEDIGSILDAPADARAGAAEPRTSFVTARRGGIVLALLGAAAIGLWLLPSSEPRSEKGSQIAPAIAHQAPSTARMDRPAEPSASLATTPAAPSASATTSASTAASPSTTTSAPAATHQASSMARPLAPVRARSTVAPSFAKHSDGGSHVAPTMAASPAEAPHVDASAPSNSLASAPRHAEISSIPMLELSPEELRAIGVTYADGKVQTFSEEYYSLESAQERSMFARMGIDTTQRTGIVRKRLVIDSAGLSMEHYEWTRVENYSRVAPIIALNSSPRSGHGAAATISSFNRSPIMDSAKRSVGSMVTALARALATDDVGSMMHDSDQANPARVLVPVHIRLGDDASLGAKRRGSDVILWYYPTREFAAALPERYRISLQKELNAIADVVECNLPPGEVCRQMTGEPMLLNYCKRISGALNGLSVSSNPAGTVTIRYRLESPRSVGAALYSIRGEYLRELLPMASSAAGVHATSLQLGDITSGAYMVVLRSEQGEQVAERLIVQ